MECYFDNAATTAVFPEVKELMMTLLDVDYGNPSSQHKKGLTAKDYERTATEQVAKTLKCMPKEIVFTSGGTEANNLALIGAALAHRRAGKHIITDTDRACVSAFHGGVPAEGRLRDQFHGSRF